MPPRVITPCPEGENQVRMPLFSPRSPKTEVDFVASSETSISGPAFAASASRAICCGSGAAPFGPRWNSPRSIALTSAVASRPVSSRL